MKDFRIKAVADEETADDETAEEEMPDNEDSDMDTDMVEVEVEVEVVGDPVGLIFPKAVLVYCDIRP